MGDHAALEGLEPAQHADPDGPIKGWNAADTPADLLSDNDYAAQFPEVSSGRTDA